MPKFDFYIPKYSKEEENTTKELFNAYIDMAQQLQWLLTHLDQKNVIRAKSVIADWVYAGSIVATQITSGTLTLSDSMTIVNSSGTLEVTATSFTFSNSGGTLTMTPDGLVIDAANVYISLTTSGFTLRTQDNAIVINNTGITLENGQITIKDSTGNSTILDQYGLDTKFIKWFKNMCWNSSFEVRYSDNTPRFWDGGVCSNASNFFDSYSLKLTAGETCIQKQEGTGISLVNPQNYNDISTITRVSFHKKGGAVKIYVLDGDNADAEFTLTDEDGNTGTFIEYANNSNWQAAAYTVSFSHSASTEIKVKFENSDVTDDAYIDGVIIEPDYTGKRPSFYTDGPYSVADSLGLVLGEETGSRIYNATNAGAATIDTSETSIASKTFTAEVKSDIFISFSTTVTAAAALELTAKTYVTVPDGSATARTYQPKQDYAAAGDYVFTYSDVIKGVDSGSVTIEVKMVTDTSSCSVAIDFGLLNIIVTPSTSLTNVLADPTSFTATASSDTQIDLSWTNPTDTGFQEVEVYRHTSSLAGKTRAWCNTNATSVYNGTSTSDSDTGLTAETTYYYRIFAEYLIDSATYYSTGVSDNATTEAALGATVGYVFGGLNANYDYFADTHEYIPDTWTAKTDMFEKKEGLASTSLSSKAYVFGGRRSTTYYTDTDEYVPDAWTGKTNMPVYKRYLAAIQISEKGYTIGGLYGSSTKLQRTDEYSSDTWTNMANMPSPPRYFLAGTTMDDKGYVFGGYYSSTLSDNDEYVVDAWTSKTSMLLSASELTSTTINGKGYVFGGQDSAVLQNCDEYVVDVWTSKTDMPTPPRTSLASTLISNKGYVFTGKADTGWGEKDCDEYDASTDAWTNKTDMPVSHGRKSNAATGL